MAYQLKTTGIAANCTMCIAVDPDTSAIKDFASSGVTADMTIGANVTTGTRTWDGNSRYYFRLGAGTAAADFVAFGTTKPSYTNNVAGTQRTLVWIGEAAGYAARVIGKDANHYLASQDIGIGGATFPRLCGMGYGSRVTGGGAAISAGAKWIFGISMIHSTSGITYAAADTDSAMTAVSVGAPTSTSTSANFDVAYVGRRNDSTAHQQDYIHAVLIFNTALTEAQWDSLRDDWFNVLLEPAAGSSPVESDLAASYSVSAPITQDLAGAYSVIATVQRDLGAAYDIETDTSVTSDLSAAYAVIATVQGDLAATYSAISSITRDLAASYSVLADGSVDLSDITEYQLVNNTGSIFAEVEFRLSFYDASTDDFVVNRTVTTDEDGLVGEVSDALLVTGTSYDIKFTNTATGAKGLLANVEAG